MYYYVLPCTNWIPIITIEYHVLPLNTMYYLEYHAVYHVLPCSTIEYHVIACITIKYHVLPGITTEYHVLPCITMYYHVIACSTIGRTMEYYVY